MKKTRLVGLLKKGLLTAALFTTICCLVSAQQEVPGAQGNAAAIQPAALPQSILGITPPDHVVIVMEENHSFSSIIGSSQAPFINSLTDGTAFVILDGKAVNISDQTAYATAYHNVLATPSGSSTASGTFNSIVQDISYSNPSYCLQPECLMLFPADPLTGSYSINTNGTGVFGGGTVSVTNGNVTFYIDNSPLNLHPSVMVAEQ